ncbi:MAG TPA: tetratricopeptide repeat protein, partial [bacterium]|nr:tetratricopeptide repeat protein [bacterium]
MKKLGAAVAVGLVALAVYVRTLCPTVYVGDSGELAWAAASLGIAHQPGYPLWTLLGRLAVLLLPGTAAYSLNLMSALAASGTAALLALLLMRVTGRIAVPAGIALAAALSRGIWTQAVVTEVYALNLLLMAGALLAAVTARGGRPVLFGLAAYLLGLGAANHPLSLAAGPAVAWLWLAPDPDRSRRDALRQTPLLAAAFLLGLSVYAYLPVRWTAGPEMVWGAVRSVGEFVDHVMRAQYGGLGEAGASFGTRIRIFVELMGESLGAPLVAAAAVGIFVGLRRDAAVGGMVALLAVFTGPLAVAAIGFGDTFLDRSVASVFFTPAVMAGFLAAGVAIAALQDVVSVRMQGGPRPALLAAAVLALLPPLSLYLLNADSCDRSESRLGERWGRTVLESLPPGARMFASGDNATFLFAYLQRVEGVRPDVVLSDRTLNLFVESYGEDFPALSREERKGRVLAREVELAYADRDVPVFFTDEVELEPFGGCRLESYGLVNRLLRPGETSPAIEEYEPFEPPPVDPDEYLEAHLAGVAMYRQGRYQLSRGDPVNARESFRVSAELGARIPTLLRNLGLEHLQIGEYASAERRFLEALELEPDNVDALYNLGVLYAYVDRVDDSIECLDRILALDDTVTEVHLTRGVQLVRAGRLDEAEAAARRALELEPGLDSARQLVRAVERGREVGGEAGILEALAMVEPLTTGGTLQLAQRYLERGEFERARELFDQAYGQAPESADAAYGLGYGLLRLGHPEAAAAAFRRVLELDPASARGRNALAYTYALSGDSLATAEVLVLEALQLDPTLAAYWNDTLGWIRYRAGKPEPALQALTEAERTLPRDDFSARAENDYH